MTPAELKAISDKVNADKAADARAAKEAEDKRWQDWKERYVQQKIEDFPDNATLRAREGYTDVIVDSLIHTDNGIPYDYRQSAFSTLYRHFKAEGYTVTEKQYDHSTLLMVSWGDSE